ncbi:LLM class flavin-dependent oxidoreductase [Streptomyces sp. JW3]|uniref:LLM class flavin-dependent oxidoreductase n=1 Tax=Streptomyces sp. JW3 TaxID=3456955 RepID=UPI003FA49587
MYVSCFLGPTGRGPADDLPLIDFCIEMGIEADKAGFALVNVGEQHFTNYEPYSDPFVIGGILARELERAWFGTTVINLAYHNPIRLAEHLNLMDLLTRGKCFLGVSTGHLPFFSSQFGVPENYRKETAFQRLDVALAAIAKDSGDPPLAWRTDLEQGTLALRIMPIGYRTGHPVVGFATNTDATIAKAGGQAWPVALGRYNLVESARRMKVYRDALQAAGHPQDAVDECLALSSVTKAIVIADTDEQAWQLAEKQLRGFMNFTCSVATRRELDDTRSMKELWDDTVPGPVDISHNTFTAPEWIQASAVIGSPETVARQLRAYEEAGICHIDARFVYVTSTPPKHGAASASSPTRSCPASAPRRSPVRRPSASVPSTASRRRPGACRGCSGEPCQGRHAAPPGWSTSHERRDRCQPVRHRRRPRRRRPLDRRRSGTGRRHERCRRCRVTRLLPQHLPPTEPGAHRMTASTIVDVHAHHLPERLGQAFTHLSGRPYPLRHKEDHSRRLAGLDEAGIDQQILGTCAIQPYWPDAAAAAEGARVANDLYAQMCAQVPRFHAFGAVPLPHTDAAATEAVRCLDELGFAGIGLGCSADGVTLDDPSLDAFWSALDERSAVVYLHPGVRNDLALGVSEYPMLLGPVFGSPPRKLSHCHDSS